MNIQYFNAWLYLLLLASEAVNIKLQVVSPQILLAEMVSRVKREISFSTVYCITIMYIIVEVETVKFEN